MAEIPVTVNKKRWHLAYKPLGYEKPDAKGERPKIWGKCDPPDASDKRIWIDPCVVSNDEHHITAILHEILHAAVWSLDEEYVDAYARTAARTLIRRGFRLTGDPDAKG